MRKRHITNQLWDLTPPERSPRERFTPESSAGSGDVPSAVRARPMAWLTSGSLAPIASRWASMASERAGERAEASKGSRNSGGWSEGKNHQQKPVEPEKTYMPPVPKLATGASYIFIPVANLSPC